MAIYDSPSILLTRSIEGDLTSRAAFAALFDQGSLSPKEKESYVDRLKDKYGGDDPLLRTAIGTVANPLFLTLALFAPGATTALRSSRGRIMSMNPESLPWATGNRFGFFGSLLEKGGFLTTNTVVRDTATEGVMHSAMRARRELMEEFASSHETPLNALYDKLGLQRGQIFDKDNTAVLNPVQAGQAERFDTLAWIHLNGRDRDVTKPFLHSNGKIVEKEVPALITGRSAIDRIRDEFGQEGVDVVQGIRSAMDRRAVRMYAYDDMIESGLRKITSSEQVDPDKLLRLQAAVPTLRDMGTEELRRTMTEVLDSINTAGDSSSIFRLLDENYFPRNRFDVIGSTRRPLGRDVSLVEALSGVSAPANPRRTAESVLAQDDLEAIARVVDDEVTDHFYTRLEKASNLSEGDIVERMNFMGSVRKYEEQTSSVINLYGSRITDETEMLAKEAGTEFVMRDAKGRVIQGADGQPLVANNATILANEYKRTAEAGIAGDPYFQKTISHLILPTLAGKWQADQGLMFSAFLGMKKAARAVITEGPLGKLIEDAGFDTFRENNRRWLSAANGLDGEASRLLWRQENSTNFLTRYLYSAHLGFNPASVLLNATQPFLLGATHLGSDNIVRAYSDALGEMKNYIGERTRQGWRPLHKHEADAAIRRSFPHADLTDISSDSLEAVDALAARVSRSGGKISNLLDNSLFFFSRVEWLNRSVVFHATRRAYEGAGLIRPGEQLADVVNRSPNFRRDVRSLVEVTQFAPNVGNTPIAFQSADPSLSPTGRLLNNPLMRMFLTFPLRSLTSVVGPTATQVGGGSRQIAGRTIQGGNLTTPLFDVVRGVAISSIIYEGGKELLNADLSDALFVEATLSIAPFTDTEGYDAPIPPIIDIPASFINGYMQGDGELIARQWARVVPGGIGASRVLDVLPRLLPQSRTSPLQREFADYNSPDPQGRIPIFNEQTGQLLRYETRYGIFANLLGLDTRRHDDPRKIDRYLQKQREEIGRYKSQLKQFIVDGQTHKAQQLQDEFMKRFGLPLVITENEVRRRADDLATPRTKRRLNALPDEMAPLYEEAVSQQLSPGERAAAQQQEAFRRPF